MISYHYLALCSYIRDVCAKIGNEMIFMLKIVKIQFCFVWSLDARFSCLLWYGFVLINTKSSVWLSICLCFGVLRVCERKCVCVLLIILYFSHLILWMNVRIRLLLSYTRLKVLVNYTNLCFIFGKYFKFLWESELNS